MGGVAWRRRIIGGKRRKVQAVGGSLTSRALRLKKPVLKILYHVLLQRLSLPLFMLHETAGRLFERVQ